MKKTTSTILLALLFATFSFTSCTKDEPASGVNSSMGTSTGDYYPMAVDNQWTMKQADTLIAPAKITGTDVFAGTTYFKLSNVLSGANIAGLEGLDIQSWITKKGGVYFTKMGDVNFSESGITMKMNGYEMTILKDNLAVGATWTATIPLKMTITMGTDTESMDMPIKYTGTILEKNVAATVNGISYPDVIKVGLKQEMSITNPDTGEVQTIVIDEEDWYANGVGPIKRTSTTEGKTTETILVDYIVKK